MEIASFVRLVPGFAELSHPERIILFGWYLHTQQRLDVLEAGAVRGCYDSVHMQPPPNIGREFARLSGRGVILESGGGRYRLEHKIRAELDSKYGEAPETIAISQLLAALPGRISDENERVFLSEVLRCYGAQAFRASTVMIWNLTFDHLLSWIMGDVARLQAFNAALTTLVAKDKRRVGLLIGKKEDFESLKESETLILCERANLIAHSLKQTLDIGLTRRNHAAHPSGIVSSRATAEEMIDTLVTNVVLRLA